MPDSLSDYAYTEHETSAKAKRVISVSELIPKEYDYIELNPPSKPTTITYKKGGAGGTTVATLTLTYTGDDIATITRA